MELKLNVMDYLLQAVALYAAQKQTEKQRLFRTEENISWHLSSFHTRKYESLAEARGGSHDHSSKSRPAQIRGQKGLYIKKKLPSVIIIQKVILIYEKRSIYSKSFKCWAVWIDTDDLRRDTVSLLRSSKVFTSTTALAQNIKPPQLTWQICWANMRQWDLGRLRLGR